jgi:hypothetical protein
LAENPFRETLEHSAVAWLTGHTTPPQPEIVMASGDNNQPTPIPPFAFKVPRTVAPSHIGQRHVERGINDLTQRIVGQNVGGRLNNVKSASTFPNASAPAQAIGKPYFPREGAEYVCDQYCGWGIRASQGVTGREASNAAKVRVIK